MGTEMLGEFLSVELNIRRESSIHHLDHETWTMIKIALYSPCKNFRDQVLCTTL